MFNLRPFQFILLGVFFIVALLGVASFSQFSGLSGSANPYGDSVEIWGVLDAASVNDEISRIREEDENFRSVQYQQRDPRSFTEDLTNAIAEGRGPDAVILSHEMILRERPKIFPIPYETLPRRDFNDTYVDGARIFNLNDGTYGFPIAVDPLVMYHNRDVLSSEGFAAPPRTWEEVLGEVSSRLTERTASGQIERSAVAFGEYVNVTNAKDTLLMLLLQAGSQLVYETDDGNLMLNLNRAATETSRPPAEASIDFYAQFANPSRSVYSWNRSLPQDTSAFLAGDLALYFGLSSEVNELRRRNPNLSFDATRVPQGADASIRRTYGIFYAFSILRSSDNRNGAYLAVRRLAQARSAERIATAQSLAPVHRQVIAEGNPDPFMQNAYDSALTARGWLDPNPAASENIFKIMIEDVTSGRMRISNAVQDAQTRINQLFR